MCRVAFVALVLILSTLVARAEEPVTPQAGAPGTVKDADTKTTCATEVIAARNAHPSEAVSPSEVRLGDVIELEVKNLPALYQEACGWGSERKPVLYLNGLALVDHEARPPSDPSSERLFFTLQRTEKSQDVWNALLGEPSLGTRSVKASVGYADRYAIPSPATLELRPVPGNWFLFWAAIFVLMAGLFVWVAMKSNVLRADPIDLGPTNPSARGPFSLARVQAAWWFFLILAAYLLIGITTGDFLSSFNGTALGLLAIGAGTVVGSVVIDSTKPPDTAANALTQAETDLNAANAASNQSQVTAAENRVKVLKEPSEGFLMDIVSDANGVVFHRFQTVAWTLVLGIIFVVEVYKNLGMPTFDATLLGLQGLSVATYLGLKIPEADTPK